MGALAFAIMYGLKRISPRIPNVLVAVAVTTVLAWATGFSHNVNVDLSAIQSAEAGKAITDFNKAVTAIPILAEERTLAGKLLEEAKKSGDPAAILDARHRFDKVAMKIEELKFDAHIFRKELRNFLFKAVKQEDGSLIFYLPKTVPADAGDDGRTWRIKVGNQPLKTSRLLMTGGGAVIGVIPKGLPALSMPRLDFGVMLHLFPFAAIISLLGFMEAISIAKAMAAKTGQRLDPNKELIGQGLANILGSVGKSYPVSGSFSRSAVNLQAGAVTGLSSVFTSLMVVIVLIFFTPLLYHLPQSVLAAVIMMAVIGLVNVSGFIHAWRAQWYDGAIAIIAFFLTLAFAPHLEKGIEVGVVLSLLVFLYKSMRPKVVSLSRREDMALRDADAFRLKECEYLALVRFDGPLFFANASYLEDRITELIRTKPRLKHIVIVSNGINDMDASGEEALSLLVDRARTAGIDISLSGVNIAVMNVLKRTHFLEKIGEDHLYTTMENAISANYTQTHAEALEKKCPLLTCCGLAEES